MGGVGINSGSRACRTQVYSRAASRGARSSSDGSEKGSLRTKVGLGLGGAVPLAAAVSAFTLDVRGVVLTDIDVQACDMNQAVRRGVSSGECWMAMR